MVWFYHELTTEKNMVSLSFFLVKKKQAHININVIVDRMKIKMENDPTNIHDCI